MAESEVHDPGAAAETSRRLNSWKEIAAYFNRDVRTVRRWESELGLPVHRRQHNGRGIIHAYESELDAWWEAGRKRSEKVNETPAGGIVDGEELAGASCSPAASRRIMLDPVGTFS